MPAVGATVTVSSPSLQLRERAVVSEETGDISVALHGRLTLVADERRLRAVLERLLEPASAQAAAQNGHGGIPE